jgi:hypothetical protein
LLCTEDVHAAANEVIGFYRNYKSLRWVGEQLVLRMNRAPSDDELRELNERFGWITTEGKIERTDPFPAEVRDGDHLELQRLVLRYSGFAAGGLRRLIDALNSVVQ